MTRRTRDLSEARKFLRTEDLAEREAMRRAFGTSLRRHRQIAKMSQRDLAARALTQFDRISQLERGVREPKLHTLIELADVLDVSPGELLRDVPAPRREATTKEIVTAVGSQPGIHVNVLAARLGVHQSYVMTMSGRLALERRVVRREQQLWPAPATNASATG